ncbi:putative secreted protein (Por secretion system target) [Lacinutrix venerupis]|nr:putative secreted protein (Por secretion system target) [Lacinutrix venerupis]
MLEVTYKSNVNVFKVNDNKFVVVFLIKIGLLYKGLIQIKKEMKAKLLFIFILIISNANAQLQAPPVPETWETDLWFVDDWLHVATVNYSFNSDCLPDYVLQQTLDFSTSIFGNSTQLSISYNANSQMTTSTNELWNANLQVWENERRTDFSYLGNNLSLVEVYIWENSNWEINETIENAYNGSDLLIESLYKEWSIPLNSLVNRDKSNYTYTAFSQIDTIINSNWDAVNSIWIDSSKITYVYNSNNVVVSKISQNWDGNQWVNNNIEVYSYDSNGFLIELLQSNWNLNTGVYDETQRKLYTNNSDGNQIIVVDQTNVLGTWTNTTRDRRTYPNCQTLNAEDVVFSSLEVYPNPVQNQLIIEIEGNTTGVIRICDVNGRKIFTQNILNRINKVDVSTLKTGMYLLQITKDNKTSTKKIIKQ